MTLHENELSNVVIRQALKIHTSLGPGLLESVYQACLIHQLASEGLRTISQKPIPLVFEGIKLDCGFRCDIIVEEKLLIEVKSVEAVTEIHHAQVLTYLKLTGMRLGLLINFNVVHLRHGIRRVVNNL
jgi:GxxExxY protein